jgi:hypothetical protein
MGRKRKQAPPRSRPSKRRGVNKLLREFLESPEGQRWRECNQQLQHYRESPEGKRWREASEQLRKFADSPAWQELRRFEASPTLRALRELKHELREIEAEEHPSPHVQAGRPLKLTQDEIKVGICLLSGRPRMLTKQACDLLRRKLKRDSSSVSDSTLYRKIISKAAWK